jgi:hypothetical protein
MLPADFDPTEPQYLIIAMDGLVLFDVGYHHNMWHCIGQNLGGCVQEYSDRDYGTIGENQHKISKVCV